MEQSRTTPKYLAIAAQLKLEINKMPRGARCPGIHEIASRFGIASATAEKILVLRQIRGFWYRRPMPDNSPMNTDLP